MVISLFTDHLKVIIVTILQDDQGRLLLLWQLHYNLCFVFLIRDYIGEVEGLGLERRD